MLVYMIHLEEIQCKGNVNQGPLEYGLH